MNKELIDARVKEKYGTMSKFAMAMDVSSTSLSEYVRGLRPTPKPIIKLMSLLLDVSEADLLKAPTPAPKQSASTIIENEALKSEISTLKSEIQALRNDLSMTAKVLMDINKTTHEIQGQAQLNHDEIAATFSKAGEINATVSKLYAYKKKGY